MTSQANTDDRYIIQNETLLKRKMLRKLKRKHFVRSECKKRKMKEMNAHASCSHTMIIYFFFSTMSIRQTKITTHVTKGPVNSFETFSVICRLHLVLSAFVRAPLPFRGIFV